MVGAGHGHVKNTSLEGTELILEISKERVYVFEMIALYIIVYLGIEYISIIYV